MAEQVDVAVIGMGVAGEGLAAALLEAGASVVSVERELIGGECRNWACVPTKMMVRAAEVLAEGRRVNDLAGSATISPQWTPVAVRIREQATNDWDDSPQVAEFTAKGGQFVRGQATLAGPGLVRVAGRTFQTALGVVLATGTRPAVPTIDGLAGTPYWTNRDAARITEVPHSVVVLGGGPVGLELAQVLRRFGAAVNLVEGADRLLAHEEPETSALAARTLEHDGVQLHIGVEATQIRHHNDEFQVRLDDGTTLNAQHLLVAVGRQTNLDGLGLETVGLDAESSTVDVDGRLRAGPQLWAIGDITGHGQFTHVATYQARIAAEDILGRNPREANYQAVPRVVYTDPEIGGVGLTEAQATRRGIPTLIGSAQIPESARGWMHGAGNAGLIKLVVDSEHGVLVGATAAGPAGGEVLGFLTLAIRAQTPIETLRDTIYAYPTFHRAIEDALRTVGASRP